jgi:rhodanese-related sulfurtransferase
MFNKLLIVSPILILLFFVSLSANAQTQYVCSPCDIDCDTQVYDAPGTCPHCGMELVDKNTVLFTDIMIDDVPKTIAANKEIIILDVRSPEEHNGTIEGRLKIGALKGAININIEELPKRVGELEKYKDREIIVYCTHSHRSRRASYILNKNGFTKVRNMADGISQWEDRNIPDELYIDYNP